MTYYTHINRQVIDSNRRRNLNDPPIRIQKGKTGKPTYAHRVKLPAGAELVYDHGQKLLACGARLVIISKDAPEVIE